jgi:hypothetical protein
MDAKGEACSMHEANKKCTGNNEERGHFEDKRLEGMIILKGILRKQEVETF